MNLEFGIAARARSVVVEYNPAIQQAVHSAHVHEGKGKRWHVVPHRPPETALLRNLGYNVPAPILSYYDWRGITPFEAQRVTSAMFTTNPRAYCLSGMGTGKTLASLFALDYLKREGIIDKAIVVAPLSTLSTVWENEVFRYFSDRRAVVLHGAKAKRLKLLDTDADLYIINHDGVETIMDALMERGDIQAAVLDEMTAYRNKRTNRWKVMNRFIAHKRFVWGLTGSPMPKAPTDAFGQIKLLTPKTTVDFYSHFQARTMLQVSQFRWVPKEGANEYVFSCMKPSVRFSLDDCVDLPPTTYTTQQTQTTPEQNKTYRKMLQDFYAQTPTGDVKAANSGVQTSKLLQIGCGFMYDEHGKAHRVAHKPRLELLMSLIEQCNEKVIVFAPFKYTVRELYEEVKRAFTAEMIHGEVGKTQRDTTFKNFQHTSNPRVLVAHPATMAHGLTLTAATTIIWYAPTSDLEVYEQANARIARPGQVNHTHIIHIQGSNLEKKMYNVLRERGNMQAELLSMFKKRTVDANH